MSSKPKSQRWSLATLKTLLAVAGASLPLVAQGPLVIPLDATVEETEGWPTAGMPLVSAVADTNGTGWVTAWSYGPVADGPHTLNEGRVMARMVKASNGSVVVPPTEEVFPLLQLSDERALDDVLSVVRGKDGAWVIWKARSGMLALWVSSITGMAVEPAILLSADSQNTTFLRAASDGTTAWVGWIEPSNPGSLVGVTLTSKEGLPQVVGHFVVAAPTDFGSVELAARSGNLLVTTGNLSFGGQFSTEVRIVNAAGQVISGPFPVSGPYSDRLDGLAGLYGSISYGSGWMVIWAQTLTVGIPTRVVFGRVLAADGSTAPGTSLRALFVEPAGSGPNKSIASIDGVGALFVTGGTNTDYGSYAALFGVGEALRFAPLPAGNANVATLGAARAGSFNGATPALLTTRGQPNNSFTQYLSAYDAHSFQEDTSVVSRGANAQEEPALAWIPGACLVGWQETSDHQKPPVVTIRQYASPRADSENSVTLPLIDPDSYSSPSMAAHGSRVLVVARKNLTNNDIDAPTDDPEDVVGVLMENGRILSGPFLIASGPGSQRAARVVACRDGFCVAWREELDAENFEILSRIRCSFLSRDGVPEMPGGITIASESLAEVSAPALAARGNTVAIVWRRLQIGSTSSVHSALRDFGSPNEPPPVTIFDEGTRARSPEVIEDEEGFLIVSRLYARNHADSIGLARLDASGALSPTSTIGWGREPAMATLGSGGVAFFWLNHVDNADSSEIWMSTRNAVGLPSAPQLIHRGRFHRDTLVARGDGHGRVMVAVQSLGLGDEGVRVMLVAPGVMGVPEIVAVTSTTGAPLVPNTGLSFRWKPNVLFPSAIGTVEGSSDLQSWAPVAAATGEVTLQGSASDPEAWFNTLSQGTHMSQLEYYYRLRPVLAN